MVLTHALKGGWIAFWSHTQITSVRRWSKLRKVALYSTSEGHTLVEFACWYMKILQNLAVTQNETIRKLRNWCYFILILNFKIWKKKKK